MKDSQGKLYNLINLEEISGGSDEFIVEMTKLFIDQARKTISGLNAAFDEKNYTEIKNLAHQIKPSIDNIKIDILSPIIREIEQLAEAEGQPDKLSPLIMETNTVLETVISQLETELETRRK
ncbi:HPt (histidine-containing phosphotransfer) domain-containing protein [Cyclobacterium lianum]|uniref:HPt (Histidine-containing phosphotransfer) domain-containing protein n=1 Tax=Cyclobacterium lianum TaxID=388280 RepID=A0A1M7P758_9BACT|nr:Hpt domain-containing protein [Cyclobacterium lianum]SHN12448.1 HPt (histidine-containing phosphotransfer) domain-containing protein [Cyclobacterium lianum]